MQSQLTPHKQAFVAMFKNPTPPLTLADLDADQSFDPLDELVRKFCGPHCKWIEFHDDNFKRGYRALEYKVRIAVTNGRADSDETGTYADTEDFEEVVFVEVLPGRSIDWIACEIMREVRAVDGNIFS